jgi:hypothetical protein
VRFPRYFKYFCRHIKAQIDLEFSRRTQVTISYGNRNNDELLQYFGFVEENCAFDRFVVEEPLLVLKQALTQANSIDGGSDAEVLTKRSAALMKAIDSAVASAASASMSATAPGAGAGAGAMADLLIVNKGEFSTWNLDQLMLLDEEDAHVDKGKGTGNAESILKQNAVIRACLRSILRAESQRLEASKAAFVITSGSDNESNEDSARNCVASLFIQEKISVLSSALDRIAKL